MKKRNLTVLLSAMMLTGAVNMPVMAEETCTVTFDLNYDGAENEEQEVKTDGRATAPENPEQEDYSFFGWYTDESCTEKFVFSTKITEDITLYAGWGKMETFEAEDVNVMEMSGPGASGAGTGKDMIVRDKNDIGASNGYYVTYLFAPADSSQYNTTLEFKVQSDTAVTDAQLYLRMTAENTSITINGDEYQLEVNGVIYNYDDLSLEVEEDLGTGTFEDYLLTSSLSLNEGENTIRLLVNNSEAAIGGTTQAKAPIVDCIKIASADGMLTWADGYPYTSNYADDE